MTATCRYSVRRVWNTPQDRETMDRLLVQDYRLRRRGRGPRNSRADWQSIPLERAAYLTYYFTPKSRGEYQWLPMRYFEYVGKDERTNKPRIRLL